MKIVDAKHCLQMEVLKRFGNGSNGSNGRALVTVLRNIETRVQTFHLLTMAKLNCKGYQFGYVYL